MDNGQGAAAVADKPVAVPSALVGAPTAAPVSAADAAKAVLLAERNKQMEAATKEINAVLEKYGMDLRINQSVQLSFKA